MTSERPASEAAPDAIDAAWDGTLSLPAAEPPATKPKAPRANGADPASARPAERLAPKDIEAEQSVLGSILIDGAVLEQVLPICTPASFYRAEHTTIYAAMLALGTAGAPIDLLTLGAELRERGDFERVGGATYLTLLMSSVPTAVHAEHYARIVAARAVARAAIEGAGRIAAIAHEEARHPDELLARIAAVTDTIAATWTVADRLPLPARLDQITPPPAPDAWLVDGLVRPGTLVMIAGPPGSAKTWASRQLALCAGAGRDYLGRYGVERPLRVLVIDEDNGNDEEWRREESLLDHLGLGRGEAGDIYRLSLAGVRLDEPRWQAWLRSLIDAWSIDLVVLDPVSEMHGGKELREDPGFRELLAFFKRLRVERPRTAIVVVHHTRKLPASERQAHRGLEEARGQWGQTPDVVVIVSPLGDRRLRWETHKRVPASALILEQIAKGRPGEGALVMVADEQVVRSTAMQHDGMVIDAIRAGLETFTDLQQAVGLPKSTLHDVLKRLMAAGVVRLSGRVYSAPEDE